MSNVKAIKQADFQSGVIGSDVPVLVDFHATWCGPCRMLAPALEGVAAAYAGRLKVVKVDVDEEPMLAASHRIRGVPTLVIYKEGRVVDTLVGVPPAGVLKGKLDAVAAAPATVGA